MKENNIFGYLKSKQIEFVRFLWVDNANIIRAKAIHINALEYSLPYPVSISCAQQGVPFIYDGIAENSGLSPVGEVFLKPDWDTLKILPYSKGHASVMADMIYFEDNWEYCPRNILNKVLYDALLKGFSFHSAFENEFYSFPNNENKKIYSNNSLFAMNQTYDQNYEFINDLSENLVLQDLNVERYYPESGSGQHEITIKYDHPLKSADNQIHFRNTVHAISYKHQLLSTFMPKVDEKLAGSGCHLHLSLYYQNENVFNNLKENNDLSKIGRYFIAGILYHLKEIMFLSTPTSNSFKRLKPHCWSGAFNCWGYDNREAALRAISSPDGKSVNHIELKTSDASANPYLALSALISAGLDGVEKKRKLPKPIGFDPGFLNEEQLNKFDIEPLPQNFGQIINYAQDSKFLRTVLGKKEFQAYSAIKTTEWNFMKKMTIELEKTILFNKF